VEQKILSQKMDILSEASIGLEKKGELIAKGERVAWNRDKGKKTKGPGKGTTREVGNCTEGSVKSVGLTEKSYF